MDYTIKKADKIRREFVAVVYRSGAEPDQQDDTMDEHELALATMRFALEPEVRLQHGDEPLPQNVVTVVSSFMTDKRSGTLPGRAWILHCKIDRSPEGDLIWRRIAAASRGEKYITLESGEKVPALTGLSLAGNAMRVEDDN